MSDLVKYSLILLIGVFISSVSQIMLKKSANKEYSSKIKEYLNPLVICAYGLFFGATLLSIFSYKVVPLSLGPILEATSYLYITILSWVFFKEKLTKRKAFALLIIILGTIIYAGGIV